MAFVTYGTPSSDRETYEMSKADDERDLLGHHEVGLDSVNSSLAVLCYPTIPGMVVVSLSPAWKLPNCIPHGSCDISGQGQTARMDARGRLDGVPGKGLDRRQSIRKVVDGVLAVGVRLSEALGVCTPGFASTMLD